MVMIELEKPCISSLRSKIKAKFYIFDKKIRNVNNKYNPIVNITFGCPSELLPSRAEVLQQLGISKEQDEEMQLKYKYL